LMLPFPLHAADTAPLASTKERPFVNSLGMTFVPVPGTQVQFCIWETRVQDFKAFVNATQYDAIQGAWTLAADGAKQRGDSWRFPGFVQTPEHPVSCVSWNDAKAFCKWLTDKERAEGRLRAGQEYRLPTDAEWSVAVGLPPEGSSAPKDKDGKIEGVYPWGSQWPPPTGAGNYAGKESKAADMPSSWRAIEGYQDSHPRTSPVGSFNANRLGLYDLGGNVWEWCEDFYNGQSGARVLRGASWSSDLRNGLLSSFRSGDAADARLGSSGFRCVLTSEDSAATPKP